MYYYGAGMICVMVLETGDDGGMHACMQFPTALRSWCNNRMFKTDMRFFLVYLQVPRRDQLCIAALSHCNRAAAQLVEEELQGTACACKCPAHALSQRHTTSDPGQTAGRRTCVHHAPMRTGVAWEIFPTSSSVCIIFLMRVASGHTFLPFILRNLPGCAKRAPGCRS